MEQKPTTARSKSLEWEVFDAALGDDLAQSRFLSAPPPPDGLWDTDDSQFLEKVRCSAKIRLTCVDPKNGRFEARMKCSWGFRTLNAGDRTEVQLRTPGIRMPGMTVQVEESRIWRDLQLSTKRTVYWRGTSLFTLSGLEIFEIQDFPYDRQIINFELMDFVWRPDKDAATYDFSMRVAEFTLEAASMLPEWATYPAIVTAENEQKLLRGPSSASRFRVCLRVERKHWYHVIQVFLVTYLITTVSCFPLAMPPTEAHIGDRLALYGGGLLTLVAFKFGIADHMPSVPYSTFTDYYLLWQIVTLIGLSVETLLAYRFVTEPGEEGGPGLLEHATVDRLENTFLVILILIWTAYFLFAAFFKTRKPWTFVLENQDKSDQVNVEEEDF
mmetsp:Transcript_105027/g.306893  ORF Transcript_105027/g.306893 Transcript_105027/m.306893 type:complete len:385 (+) Transcript_105027:104-1258(+)